MRGRASLALVGLLGAACSGGGGAAPTTSAGPPTSAPPATVVVPEGEPGSVVEAEPIDVDGVEALRVTYLSEGVGGEVVEVTGIVLVPGGEPPAGGWPVVAWAHGTTGGADACAPSADDGGAGLASVFGGLAQAGYVVAATDYEGVGGPGPHPYLNGPSAARSVADSVRAARASVPGTGPAWVAAGYSQGGHAALWAAEEGPAYAPDLDLLGAVAVAPASALELFPLLDGGPGVAFLLLVLAGFTAAEPGVDPATVLSEAGRNGVELVEQECLAALATLYGRPGVGSPLVEGAAEPGTPFGDYLLANEPGRGAPAVPVLVLQGSGDQLVTPAMTQVVVDRLCGLQATVELRTFPGADHATIATVAAADARAWIDERFERPPPPPASTC